MSRIVLAALTLWLAFPALADLGIELVPVASGFDSPVALTHAPGDTTRLFVIEQPGRVLIMRGVQVDETPFLDITDRVRCCGERGLLSIAFHPLHGLNGYVYVDYTASSSGATVVSRFATFPEDPERLDPTSELILLTIPQPFSNHNGGQLQFGRDGYLYIGTGDGGSAGDPGNRAQNLLELLGKLLRIDVDSGSPYGIPPDNPFANLDNAQPEIWAFGLRNPWRFSFDRSTGDLYIGDVGQNRFEEIDMQPATSRGGDNYGWRRMEASSCFNPSTSCDTGNLTLPILEYSHDDGCSVTGGFVHRGSSKRLNGIYFYGDYCSGMIWGAVRQLDGSWTNVVEIRTGLSISSFGEDASGELYVVDIGGRIFRIEDSTPPRRRPVRR